MRRIQILRLVWGAWALGLLLTVAAPLAVRADGGAATFFIAHPDTHAEAAQDNPILVSGGKPVSVEVRIRDAGTADKAGWQTSLLVDACEFEIPSTSAIVLGDMFGTGIPVRQVLPVENDIVRIKLGQVMFLGSITAADGLLATVTLTPKAQRSCPPGGAGIAPGKIRFVDAPGTQWAAPGGVKLPFQAQPGHFIRTSNAAASAQSAANRTAVGWPLLAVALAALLAGAAALAWRVVRRTSR